MEAEVRHDRDHHGVVAEPAACAQVTGTDGQDVIAVHNVTALVDCDQPIGIAIEGNADMGTLGRDDRLEPGRVGRAALGIDVGAIRLGVDHDDVSASALEHLGSEMRGGPVGRIDASKSSATAPQRHGGPGATPTLK